MKNRMLQLIGLLMTLVVGTSVAEFVEVDIRPDDLLGGAADEQLRELGRKAADEGLEITLTSPGYWREIIEEQLRAGAGDVEIDIRHRTTFVESVIVRMGDRPADTIPQPAAVAETPPAERAPAPAAPIAPAGPSVDARAARAAVADQMREEAAQAVTRTATPPATPDVPVPDIKPVVSRVDPSEIMGAGASSGQAGSTTPADRPAASSPPAASPPAEPVPVTPELVTPEPVMADPVAEAPATVEPPAVALADAPVEDTEALDSGAEEATMSDEDARSSLERRLNSGRPVTKTLSVSQVRRGDQIFSTAGVIAVVRPTRLGRNMFWLDGSIDLEDPGLRREQAGKYDVIDDLTDLADGSTSVPAETASTADSAAASEGEPGELAAVEGDALAAERAEMEARYNQGRPIESTLSLAGLQTNDLLYRGDALTVVVRRDRIGLKRYWLVGDLDFEIEELEQAGSNKYRVRRSIR